jgi:undecaprenyl diphosphate synthase
MLEKFKDLMKREKEEVLKIKVPRHIAITMEGIEAWSKKNNKTLEEAYEKSFVILRSTIKSSIKLDIPILTFYMLPEKIKKDTKEYPEKINYIIEFLENLVNGELISNNRIKVSVLGKWYDLPGRAVEAIKRIIEETKDYDNFFVNFCINYDGQEEIVDACKLIARQIKAEKLDPDSINKNVIKENIYSSNFLPPDLIIKNGTKKESSGILLWDSIHARICFTNKFWPDFDRTEFMDAIKEYQKGH